MFQLARIEKSRSTIFFLRGPKIKRFNETLLKYDKHCPQSGKENRATVSVF